MISQIYWLVPNYILYWKMSGRISGVEISTMATFIANKVDMSASRKVHLIINCTGVQQLDSANQQARAALRLLATQRGMGKVVAVVSNYQIQGQLNALSGAFGSKWGNVLSMTAAIQSLKKSDNLLQTVPSLALSSLIVRPE
jgi:hypothetical protein